MTVGEPAGFILDANFDALFPGLRCEDQELGGAVPNLEFFFRFHEAKGFSQRRKAAKGRKPHRDSDKFLGLPIPSHSKGLKPAFEREF